VAVDIVMRVSLLYRLCSVAAVAFGAAAGAAKALVAYGRPLCSLYVSFSLLSLVLQ
jgi:hypothetical protein